MAITSQPKNLENENIIKSQIKTMSALLFLLKPIVRQMDFEVNEITTPFELDFNKSTLLYLTSTPAKKAYNYLLKKSLNCALKCT